MVRVCFITDSVIFIDCFQNAYIILHIIFYYLADQLANRANKI